MGGWWFVAWHQYQKSKKNVLFPLFGGGAQASTIQRTNSPQFVLVLLLLRRRRRLLLFDGTSVLQTIIIISIIGKTAQRHHHRNNNPVAHGYVMVKVHAPTEDSE